MSINPGARDLPRRFSSSRRGDASLPDSVHLLLEGLWPRFGQSNSQRKIDAAGITGLFFGRFVPPCLYVLSHIGFYSAYTDDHAHGSLFDRYCSSVVEFYFVLGVPVTCVFECIMRALYTFTLLYIHACVHYIHIYIHIRSQL